MKKTLFLSIKIIFYGIVLPFKMWQFSKSKLMSKSDEGSIINLIDEDYIFTSWLDMAIDALIFILYPIGIISVLSIFIFTDVSYYAFLALLPLYFSTMMISFARELGGSFMLLHLNVNKIIDLIDNKIETK